MAEAFLDNLVQNVLGTHGSRFAIAPGIVKNNLDVLGLARIQVAVPSRPNFEPWARLCAIGASSSRGFIWAPQIDDEVLVAFAENDLGSAYILGGLWSTMNSPPLSLPTDFLIKKVLKTGATQALGHEIEFDDALQSISIKTSTSQKITLDPKAIELTNLAGTVTITLDNTTQAVKITAVNKIQLQALQIELKGTKIDLTAANVSINSTGPCSVTGLPIKLN